MRNTILILALATLLPAPTVHGQATEAQGEGRLKPMSARKFRRLTVDGETVAKNVKRLTTELRWHKSLSSALTEARAKSKPVVWIQALGDLKGFL